MGAQLVWFQSPSVLFYVTTRAASHANLSLSVALA